MDEQQTKQIEISPFMHDLIQRKLELFYNKRLEPHESIWDFQSFYIAVSLIGAMIPELRLTKKSMQERNLIYTYYISGCIEQAQKLVQKEKYADNKDYYQTYHRELKNKWMDLRREAFTMMQTYVEEDMEKIIYPYRTLSEKQMVGGKIGTQDVGFRALGKFEMPSGRQGVGYLQ